jgi:hypothetical protein
MRRKWVDLKAEGDDQLWKKPLMNRLSSGSALGKRGRVPRISGSYSAEIVNSERVSNVNNCAVNGSGLSRFGTLLPFRHKRDSGRAEWTEANFRLSSDTCTRLP